MEHTREEPPRPALEVLAAVDSRACFDASMVQDQAIGGARVIARVTLIVGFARNGDAMQAMVLRKHGSALEWTDLADRQPGPCEIRVKVAACGVCRTDLHVVDGELPGPK
ncbi:MAG: hypothetical protein ACRECP_03925, partial [Methylocella sp.]